jgi:formylglycine-generating enzyme
MAGLRGWVHIVGCMVGLAACGSVHPSVVGSDDGGVDGGEDRLGDGAIGAPLPPSCVGLAATCGVGSKDGCCSSSVVTGGTYYRGYDKAADGIFGDAGNPATVNDFRLDKYEVTVGRFRAFVEAGMGTRSSPPVAGAGAHVNIAGSGWDANWNTSLAADKAALIAAVKCDSASQLWTDTPGSNEDRPMNCIDWYEAMAFCAWDGGELPTEAEWNYAATGGDQQRAYPWSSPAGSLMLDGSYASYADGVNCVGDGMPGCAATDLLTVGSKSLGNGRWGQSDLAGNVYEWTLDWYALYTNPCMNCANLTAASMRVMRGGSFYAGVNYVRTGLRNFGPPTGRSGELGVRCARTP